MLCKPDGVETVKTLPGEAAAPLLAGDKLVGEINDEGKLRLTDPKTKKVTWLQTNYDGRQAAIFSVACQRDGKIYGSSLLPGHTFYYDTASGRLADLGILDTRQVPGVRHDQPAAGAVSGQLLRGVRGPLRSGRAAGQRQESAPARTRGRPGAAGPVVPRPRRNALHGHRPVQGPTGRGAACVSTRATCRSRSGRARSPIRASCMSRRCRRAEQLFCVTSVQGGSSAIPTEKEALRIPLGPEERSHGVPVAADPRNAVVRPGDPARNGLIYGLAAGSYYVFDPKARSVVFTGLAAGQEPSFSRVARRAGRPARPDRGAGRRRRLHHRPGRQPREGPRASRIASSGHTAST